MPGSESIEVVFGKGQPEYEPLPAVYLDTLSRPVLSRWRFTEEERAAIAAGADIVLTILTFGGPLAPSHLQVVKPEEMPLFVEEPA
jgi:hypothetical protein